MSEINISSVINRLAQGKGLDEAVKEAEVNDNTEVTSEEVVEEKVAETEVEETEATETEPLDEIDELAAKVAERLKEDAKEEEPELDKVAVLVEEYNEEMAKLAESQDYIISTLFNAACVEDGVASSEDIVKMASEEDSLAEHLLVEITKYAEAADELLGAKYDEDYDEDDVIKLAAYMIDSVENPFNLVEVEEEETKEAEEVNEMDDLAEKVAKKIIDLANEKE